MMLVGELTVLRLVFAASVALAFFALILALLGLRLRRLQLAFSAVVGAAMCAAWVAVGLSPSTDREVAAGSITAALAACLGAYALTLGFERARRLDRELERGRSQLRAMVDKEVSTRGEELEMILARARADSASLLTKRERELAEARTHAIAEAERATGERLSQSFAAIQKDMDDRIASWKHDLAQTERTLETDVAELLRKHQALAQEAATRFRAESQRMTAESEEHRATILRLRTEIREAAEQATLATQADLESEGNERRRVLNDISERLRRREGELLEKIELEEVEAQRRIQAGSAEIERRQIEQLKRVLERASDSVSEAAAAQFEEATKVAREEAAHRLNRELDRAVEAFSRQAQTLLVERMRILSEGAESRMEKRLEQSIGELNQRADRMWSAVEKRVAELELEIRARLDTLAVETESKRTTIETRLHDLHQLLDESGSRPAPRLSEDPPR